MDLPSHFLALQGLFWGWCFGIITGELKNASLPTTRCGSYPCWKFSPPVALVTCELMHVQVSELQAGIKDVIPFLEWVDLQGHLSSMKLVAKELDSLTSGRRT
ncbi:hypothetical protein CK203_057670 [Vitis vinifera]|uniref:Uncharacterized protein n=1 Tax=Vitis vinifera TaxID=29760 RepID=A0A438GVS2_VITVI|nr:hypothetical protein CK203_057670 [Vitis vinifera]